MMKILVSSIAIFILLFGLVVIAPPQEGFPCDYFYSKDAVCDPANNMYCMNNVCTTYTGDLKKCTGPSSPENTKGTVEVTSRNAQNGAVIQESFSDKCYKEGAGDFASSCSGENCKTQKYFCVGSSYQVSITSCGSCNDGACTKETQSQVSTQPKCTDNDNDGFKVGDDCGTKDCDDSDKEIHPDNLINIVGGCGNQPCDVNHVNEVCNDNKDNDCDGNKDMQDNECTGINHCKNKVKDVDESGTDCGGAYCNACPKSLELEKPTADVKIEEPPIKIDDIDEEPEKICPKSEECSDGEYRCNIDTGEVFVCENNEWSEGTESHNNLCKREIQKECVPGELVCDTENDIYRTCDSFGFLSEGIRDDYLQVCESQGCVSSVAEFKCDNRNRRVSNCLNGIWTKFSSEGYRDKCIVENEDSGIFKKLRNLFSSLF